MTLNIKKTKYMAYNTEDEGTCLKAINGDKLVRQADFKYLGSWIDNTSRDIKVRKALAWKALHSMKNVWCTKMSKHLKVQLFVATVESVLLYGCVAWTLTSVLDKQLDGCYTRMLHHVLGIGSEEHQTQTFISGSPSLAPKSALED